MDVEELWRRVERSFDALEPPEQSSDTAATDAPKDEAEKAEAKRRRRRWRRVLDILGTLFWAYVLIKLLAWDVDEWALDSISPGLSDLLDYRLLIVVAAVVICAIFFRWKVLVSIAYILGFPFVVLFWKLPWLLGRRRSWMLVLSVANVVAVFGSRVRLRLIIGGLAILAAAAILLTSAAPLIVPAMVVIVVWLCWTLWYTLKSALTPSRFLRLQEDFIARTVNRDVIKNLALPPEDLVTSDAPDLYSREQITQFAGRVTAVVGINRGLYLWAYQLQRYRRSTASMLFAGISYLWLFLSASLAMTLLNVGILHLDASEFSYTHGTPSFARMALYAVSTLAFNSAGGITPVGDAASLVAVGAGIVGVVFIASFAVAVIIALRPEREGADAERVVAVLKQRAAEQDERLREGLHVGIDEAITRLKRVGHDLNFMIVWMTKNVPDDFYDQ